MLWCQINPRETPLHHPHVKRQKQSPKILIIYFILFFPLLREKMNHKEKKKGRQRKKGTCVIDSMKWTKEKGWGVCVINN